MERRYKIGGGIALLLLLGIIAGDHYINEHRNLNTTSTEAQAASPATDVTSAAVDTPPANTNAQDGTLNNTVSVDNSTDAQQPLTTTAPTAVLAARGTRKHVYKKQVVLQSAPVITNNDVAVNTPSGKGINLVVTVNAPASDIKIEKSKVYFGNIPEKAKKHHKGFPMDLLGAEVGYSQGVFYNNNTTNMPVGNVTAGLLLNLNLSKHLAVQPGIRYMTGGNRLMSDMDVNTNEKLTLHYFEVPVDLVYKFGQPGKTRILVGAGPYVAYLSRAKENFSTAPAENTDIVETPHYSVNNLNTYDWGVGGFVGVQSPQGFFAKVGTEYGMTNVTTNSNTSDRNNNFIATFGYIIGGK